MSLLVSRSFSHLAPQRPCSAQHCCPSSKGFPRPRAAPAHRPRRPLKRSTALAAGAIQEMNSEELSVAIAERDRPLVIDFSADWCGPCRLLTTELEQVAQELGDKIKIIKIDTEKNVELSSQLRIEGLPTMVFVGMNKEKPALRTEGLLSAKNIVEIIQNELS